MLHCALEAQLNNQLKALPLSPPPSCPPPSFLITSTNRRTYPQPTETKLHPIEPAIKGPKTECGLFYFFNLNVNCSQLLLTQIILNSFNKTTNPEKSHKYLQIYESVITLYLTPHHDKILKCCPLYVKLI